MSESDITFVYSSDEEEEDEEINKEKSKSTTKKKKRIKIVPMNYFTTEYWTPYRTNFETSHGRSLDEIEKFLNQIQMPHHVFGRENVRATQFVKKISEIRVFNAYRRDYQYKNHPRVRREMQKHVLIRQPRMVNLSLSPTSDSSVSTKSTCEEVPNISNTYVPKFTTSYFVEGERPDYHPNNMFRTKGQKISLLESNEYIEPEQLYIRDGVSYDIDKFRVFLEVLDANFWKLLPKDTFPRLILGSQAWGPLYGYHCKIQPWSRTSYLDPEETLKFHGDKLHFSPIINQMGCLCRAPFEVWIEQKHGYDFIMAMNERGWHVGLNDNRQRTRNMLDWDTCKRNPPSICTVLSALQDIRVTNVMMRMQGMRWKVAKKDDPVSYFLDGLENMQQLFREGGCELSLTHIDIAQEWQIPTKVSNPEDGFPHDVKIPRWTSSGKDANRRSTEFYCTKKSKYAKTTVEYYPMFTGLTGVKDGGITITNSGCHRSKYCNGLSKMTCYLGTLHHTMRERRVNIPDLNSFQCRQMEDWSIRKTQIYCQSLATDLTKMASLLLNERIPFQMRTEMKFRFSFSKCDANSELRTQFGLRHFIAICNDIDDIRDTWRVSLSRRPVYLSGICKAVQLNIGQMYREVSRRMKGTLKEYMPGNSFKYFRYLNSNVLCNLGFSGTRVDQWKFQWLCLPPGERPDYDGVAFLYQLQQLQEEQYESLLGDKLSRVLNARKDNHAKGEIPKMGAYLLLDQYGIPTEAGLQRIFNAEREREHMKKRLRGEPIPRSLFHYHLDFLEKTLKLTKHYRIQRTKQYNLRDQDSPNPVPSYGPIIATRKFLEKCDITQGKDIPRVNGIGIRFYPLHIVITPRVFDGLRCNHALQNATYERLMKIIGISLEQNDEDEEDTNINKDFTSFLQRQLDMEYKIHTEADIEAVNCALDRAPVDEEEYYLWLDQEPISYPIHSDEANRELSRLILKKGKKAPGIKNLSEDTIDTIKTSLNFPSSKEILHRMANVRLGFKFPKISTITHSKMLEEIAREYGYKFKSREIQDRDSHYDLMPEVNAIYEGTITVNNQTYNFADWINDDTVYYPNMKNKNVGYELVRNILKKNRKYASVEPLSPNTILAIKNNPRVCCIVATLRPFCRHHLGMKIPMTLKKLEIYHILASFYGYYLVPEERSVRTPSVVYQDEFDFTNSPPPLQPLSKVLPRFVHEETAEHINFSDVTTDEEENLNEEAPMTQEETKTQEGHMGSDRGLVEDLFNKYSKNYSDRIWTSSQPPQESLETQEGLTMESLNRNHRGRRKDGLVETNDIILETVPGKSTMEPRLVTRTERPKITRLRTSFGYPEPRQRPVKNSIILGTQVTKKKKRRTGIHGYGFHNRPPPPPPDSTDDEAEIQLPPQRHVSTEASGHPRHRIRDKTSGFIGIRNASNQCYVNSVLQLLRHTGSFNTNFSRTVQHYMASATDTNDTMSCEFVNFLTCYKVQPMSLGPIDIHSFHKARMKHLGDFSANGQECAAHFLQQLLSTMENEVDCERLIRVEFEIRVAHLLTCKSCNWDKNPMEEKFRTLLLSFPGLKFQIRSLSDLIVGDFKNWNEPIEVHCDCCGKDRLFTSRKVPTTAPKNLLFNLKRYFYDNGAYRKTTTRIKLPDNYNFEVENMVGGVTIVPYKLTAVIVHEGQRVDQGHYTCFVKIGDNWIKCNDGEIQQLDMRCKYFIEMNSYIVLYSRKDT